MSTQFESVPRAVAETQYRAIWRVRGEDPPRDEVEAYLDYYEASILLGTAEEWTQERMESAQKRWKRLLLRRHGRRRGGRSRRPR